MPGRWQPEPPTKPGLYWARWDRRCKPQLVGISWIGRVLDIEYHYGEVRVRGDAVTAPNSYNVSEWRLWWSEPVTPPEVT